ncbi:hypothetical protein SAMN04244553_2946 [Nocardia amikacinitolerans]|uniref:Uncharacterized protein n=1 Tax=Nocardia amikacinitolerans TaxID=756689 RepID=A0A285L914_9NOCA|nr:hypothetical protein [Nocardia amikacinitolerans]MCP2298914.1 hypothetical protein [Nocardia amikacinitolerans]SNY81354.1 hypothetical protein SAMN04244553_2946 [Nocardia amikacinitolerans]
MSEYACGDCWRRENLTFAQRLDPAFIRRGSGHLCEEHRASRNESRRPAPLAQRACPSRSTSGKEGSHR